MLGPLSGPAVQPEGKGILGLRCPLTASQVWGLFSLISVSPSACEHWSECGWQREAIHRFSAPPSLSVLIFEMG